jgi:hypothetical protein
VRLAGLLLLVLAVGAGGLLWSQAQQSSPGPTAANVPAAGAIWFGTSVNTSTGEVSGHADTFSQSAQIVAVAHLPQPMSGGQIVSFTIDGVIVESSSPSGSSFDLVWLTISPGRLTAGVHGFGVEDSGANSLASGTVTITP